MEWICTYRNHVFEIPAYDMETINTVFSFVLKKANKLKTRRRIQIQNAIYFIYFNSIELIIKWYSIWNINKFYFKHIRFTYINTSCLLLLLLFSYFSCWKSLFNIFFFLSFLYEEIFVFSFFRFCIQEINNTLA